MKPLYSGIFIGVLISLLNPGMARQTTEISNRPAQSSLAELKRVARPLLIFSTDALNTHFQKQLEFLHVTSREDKTGAGELTERRVVLIPILESGEYLPTTGASLFHLLPVDEASRLRKEFGVKPGEFETVLIGTDGTAKKVWRTPVRLQSVLELIDGMPGRQSERREAERHPPR